MTEREPTGSAAEGYRVHVCYGRNCSPRGSQALVPALESAVRRAGIADRVEIIATSCRARCEDGPSVNVYPGPTFYNWVTPDAIEEIVREHLVGGRPVARYLARPRPTKPSQGQRYTGRSRRWAGR